MPPEWAEGAIRAPNLGQALRNHRELFAMRRCQGEAGLLRSHIPDQLWPQDNRPRPENNTSREAIED